ncbi:MAG: hypothetical protein J0J01_19175 [Reyranella sp.]|nr:hypothetical protein [Reyranella sp.]MBN9089035.1 hypothetical protein [Reyranella sp.]
MSDTSDFRQSNGRFAKGHPGGPGRPRNPVSTTAIELDRVGSEVAHELMSATIERARRGNLRATELVLQRVWPVRRHRPIELEPPSGDGLRNLLGEHATLAQAMMNGDITPQDAQATVRVFKALQEQMRRADYQAETVGLPKTAKTA